MTDTHLISSFIELIFGLVIFIMFWNLCSNIGRIKKGIEQLSKKGLTQSEKELVEKLK